MDADRIERLVTQARWQLNQQFQNVDILVYFWRLLGCAPPGLD